MTVEIQISLSSKQVALERYLPFIKQGALTIYSKEELNFGEEVEIHVKMSELKQEISCEARVVWISSDDYQNQKKYGLQLLGEAGFELNQILENYLAGLIKHDE